MKKNQAQAEKTIKKYIVGSHSVMRVLAWISAAAAIAMLLMCTAFKASSSTDDAKVFDPMVKTSDYVYLDVVGVSDWLMQYTYNGSSTYYFAAEDADNYLYVIEMSLSDFKKMDKQHDWWNSDESGTMPEPYRLYGISTTITSSRASDISDVLEISEDEYEQYFGEYVLNVGTSPAGQRNAAFGFLTGLFVLLWIIFATLYGKTFKNLKKTLKVLRRAGEVEQAAAELENSDNAVIGADYARVTEHYLFGRKTGTVVRYSDILWFHDSRKRYKNRTNTYLTIHTPNAKSINAIDFGYALDANELLQTTANAILYYNPSALCGLGSENRKEYNRRVKAIKSAGK